MQTITWTTDTLGTMHHTVPDAEVMPRVQALITLGFSPTVTLDTASESE